MKSYYLNVGILDLAFLGGHIAVFMLIVFAAYKVLLVNDKKTEYIVLGFFAAQILIVLADVLLNVMPDFPDSHKYIDGYNSEFVINKSVAVYVKIMRVVSAVFLLSSPIHFVLFQKLILAISFITIASSFRGVVGLRKDRELNKRLQRVVLVVLFMYPAPLVFTSAPLREFMVIFVFSIYLKALMDVLINRFKVGNMVLLLLSLVLMYFVRFQFVVSMVFPLVYILSFYIKRKLLRIALMPFIVIVALYLVNLYVESIGYGGLFTPEGFTKLRQYYLGKFGSTGMMYGAGVFHSYFDLAAFVPSMFLQYMLAPIPVLASMGSQFGTTDVIDEVFILILVLYLLGKVKFLINNRVVGFLFVSFLLTVLPMSVFEFYLSSVPRHRMTSIFLLIVMASIIYVANNSKSFSKNGNPRK
jgi:hypothetical protein